MTISKPTQAKENSLSRDLVEAARYYLGGRRGLLAVATIVIISGLVLNWGWLVAAGIAPILLTLAPCAIMCGLGVCWMKMKGGSSESKSTQSQKAAETTAESSAPVQLSTCSNDRAGVSTSTDQKQLQPLDERRDPHA